MSIGSNLSAGSVQSMFDQMRQRMQTVNNAAANFLGVSPQDLRTQLDSGKSLSDIATAQGKSADGLKAAISTALQSEGAASADNTALVDRIVSGHKGHGGHHVHKSGGDTDDKSMRPQNWMPTSNPMQTTQSTPPKPIDPTTPGFPSPRGILSEI